MNPSSPKSSSYLAALLFGALLLTGLLAYQAVDSARSHRATAEQTLSDYAGFAAWQFARQARDDLSRAFMEGRRRLMPTGTLPATGPLPDPPEYEPIECPSDCPVIRPIHFFFALDLESEALRFSGADVGPSMTGWLPDTLRYHARERYKSGWGYSVLPIAGETDRMLVYFLEFDCETRDPYMAYGFAFDASSLDPIFGHILSDKDLIPPTLLAGVGGDSLMQASVTALAAGYAFHSGDAQHSPFRSVADLGARFGDMQVELSLDPGMAPALVIGGLPGSRLPLLVLLLVLTCGLIGAAVRQFRKEIELAGLRSDFVSSVSHELRTPLAQIRMFAETLMLNRTRSSEEKERSLRIIDQEARRLSHLVDNVLLFSRADRRSMRLHREPTDVSTLVREAMEAFAPVAAASEMTLLNLCREKAPAAVDRAVLRQVLINLFDNAVKYGPPGQTIIAVVTVDGDSIEIAIEDEGPGIPPADASRVWDPFVRLHRHDATNVAGSGIGLAVVKEYVALHDGTVRVEQRPGGGARFVITLNRLIVYGAGVSGDGASMELPASIS